MSGPARPNQRDQRAQAGGAVALPRPARAPAPAVPPLGGRLVDGIKGLPDHRWLERLLRGRAWIALIGLALGGIVAMQVSMLKLNAGIGRAVESAATLERQNADLRATVSQLSSEERIQREAVAMGLQMPPAGEVRYLTSRGLEDARRAAQIMRAPSEQALALTTAAAGATAATGTDPAAAAAAPVGDPAAAAADPAAPEQAAPAVPEQQPAASAPAPAATPAPAPAPAPAQQPAAASSGGAAAPVAGATP